LGRIFAVRREADVTSSQARRTVISALAIFSILAALIYWRQSQTVVSGELDWAFHLQVEQVDQLPDSTHEKRYPVLMDGMWGYIDDEGDIAIEPEWDASSNFYNGYAGVADRRFLDWSKEDPGAGLLWGFLNTKGEVVIEPQFTGVTPFANGVAGARDPSQSALIRTEPDWGLIDERGAWRVPPRFDHILPFSDNRAAVQIAGLWGYIDSSGAIRIAPKFVEAGQFSEGVAPVRFTKNRSSSNSEAWGFIDLDGNEMSDNRYIYAKSFSEGLAAAQTADTKSASDADALWGFVDRSGAWIVPPTYFDCGSFQHGVAPVEVRDDQSGIYSYRYITRDGKPAFDKSFMRAYDFHDGAALVMFDVNLDEGIISDHIIESWGYIGLDGHMIWSTDTRAN
jgi:hypothetical protein